MEPPTSLALGTPQGGRPPAAWQSQFRGGKLGLAVACLALSGCAVQPWVKPYEREKLADPIMQWSRQALVDKHREHIHTVREGARGATGVQGGGCGCN